MNFLSEKRFSVLFVAFFFQKDQQRGEEDLRGRTTMHVCGVTTNGIGTGRRGSALFRPAFCVATHLIIPMCLALRRRHRLPFRVILASRAPHRVLIAVAIARSSFAALPLGRRGLRSSFSSTTILLLWLLGSHRAAATGIVSLNAGRTKFSVPAGCNYSSIVPLYSL